MQTLPFRSDNPFVDKVLSIFLPYPPLMSTIAGVVGGENVAILRFRPKRAEDADAIKEELVHTIRKEACEASLAARAQRVVVQGIDNFFIMFQPHQHST